MSSSFSLGARFDEGWEGKGGGEAGLFIGRRTASNDGLKRRQSRNCSCHVFGCGILDWRKMTMMSSSASAWDPYVIGRREKNWARGGGCSRGLASWASAVRTRAGGKGSAGPARALLARAGLSNSLFFCSFLFCFENSYSCLKQIKNQTTFNYF